MPLTQVSSRLIEDTLRYVLGASGTSHYTFTGKGLNGAVNDPTLTLSRGHTYIFENRSGGHPFYIKTSIDNGGTNDAYNTGVTNNGGGNGTEIVFTVPHDAPDLLYYQCSSHSSMAGQLKIAGAVADGSITAAKLGNGAVTADKIGSGQVTEVKLATNAVTQTKIADNAVIVDKLPDSVISTAKIADNAVTDAKINGMAASKLTGALPAISGANLTGITAGITEADQWRVTSDFTMNSQYAATITANWERNDTSFEKIGTGMSVDGNGHWTFPSTGIWLIQVLWIGASNSGSTHWGIHYAYGMTDGVQSNGFEIMKSYVGNAANYSRNTGFMSAIFDVQNTSGYKLLFGYYDNNVQTTVYKGNTSSNENSYTFIRLGDT